MSKSKNDFKMCNSLNNNVFFSTGWPTPGAGSHTYSESLSQHADSVLICKCSNSSFFKGKHLDNYFLTEVETNFIATF